MSYGFTVTHDYGYVILACASTFIMGTVHGFNTGKWRRLSKIGYPNAYASEEKAKVDPNAYGLNCAQRSHANFVENQPTVVAAMLVAGLRYPVASAICGAGWTLSRYVYMWGYNNPGLGEGGRGRYYGITHMLFSFALMGLTIATGINVIASR